MIYLWRPTEGEITDYRLSEDLHSLKEHIMDNYGEGVNFAKYYNMIAVENELTEIGYIAEIKMV